MIDWTSVQKEIHRRVALPLRRTSEYTLARARHHAPVRAIFNRDRRGPEFKRKGAITTAQQYRAFLRSKERTRRVDVRKSQAGERTFGQVGDSSGRLVGGQATISDPVSRTAVAAFASRQGLANRGGSFSGHANSLLPVFEEGGYHITGDFRKMSRVPDIIRQRPGKTAARVVRRESLEMHSGMYFAGGQRPDFERFRASQLSSRGRYETVNARVPRRGIAPSGQVFESAPLFKGRVGGRLRGEIHILEPRWIGTTMWAYVQSPTPYARYQEFGSNHNRAHPYLRPALYESRKVLIAEVRKEFA
jgi:hypothetical protein